MGAFWDKLLSLFRSDDEETGDGQGPTVQWIPPEDNVWGVPVLDLRPVTQGILSATTDPAAAERSLSWGNSVGEELEESPIPDEGIDCELRYPVASSFPDGLLFAPRSMEEKWVLTHRSGRILAARSWTGTVEAVAETRREGGELIVTRLRTAGETMLGTFGSPVEIFDWLIRSHALDEVLPLPIDDAGADLLENVPQAVFSPFGSRALFAARGWDPPEAPPLRVDGRVLAAVRRGDVAALAPLVAAGEPVDTPGTYAGYTPLHVAVVRGDGAAVATLLELGADPRTRDDAGNYALGMALVHGGEPALLEQLLAAGADPHAANDDRFGLLHAAAETDRGDMVPWILEQGVRLEARTRHGHTALHIACALGQLKAAEALLAAGADPQAESPGGTPRQVAESEGKAEAVALLDRQ